MTVACSFCDIVAGRAAADVVFRSADVIAFLPRVLYAAGHTLIAPCRHVATIWECQNDELSRLAAVARDLSLRSCEALGATGCNLLHASGEDAQQSVPHVHVHLLPRYAGDGIDAWPALSPVAVDRAVLVRKLGGM
ncbi:MAG: HIT family protein [Kofleriaceae bacterium]